MMRQVHIVNLVAATIGALAAALLIDGNVKLSSFAGWFLVVLFALYVSEIAISKMKRSNG
ncbi:hypothetical protein [Sphingomonas sp. GB1N7]|uniref:hypothetical protein n=1 Tax=Parasphingomonas caseinilytica TaxID=3096158 RepID=UPI002FC84851